MEKAYIALQQKVVMEARSWLGTRFLHQGRRKKSLYEKGGVDCLGLLMGVASTLQLCDKEGQAFIRHDTYDYSKQPSQARLIRDLDKAMQRIPEQKAFQLADVVLLEMDGNAQHLAFISDYGEDDWGIIHAYAPCKAVIEHRLDGFWRSKICMVYRLELPR